MLGLIPQIDVLRQQCSQALNEIETGQAQLEEIDRLAQDLLGRGNERIKACERCLREAEPLVTRATVFLRIGLLLVGSSIPLIMFKEVSPTWGKRGFLACLGGGVVSSCSFYQNRKAGTKVGQAKEHSRLATQLFEDRWQLVKQASNLLDDLDEARAATFSNLYQAQRLIDLEKRALQQLVGGL